MKLMFCPLHYLDDTLLIDVHRTFHRIESYYVKGKKDNPFVKFIYDYKDRRNWFLQLHKRCVVEMDFRFEHLKRNNGVHPTPPILSSSMLSYRTWIPSVNPYIQNDIKYLIHRYRFKRKKIVYTNRPLPDFLKDIKRDIDASCDNCIYFSDNVKQKKCFNSKFRKPGGFCDNWTDGTVKYIDSFYDFFKE